MFYVFARLLPSKIEGAGVGVFAIENIAKGTDPFIGCENDLRLMDMHEYDYLSNEKKKMVLDFCYQNNGFWHVPKNFNKIDISWYVNSSSEPNLSFDPETGKYTTLRDISIGEELTYDYILYSL